MIVSGIILYLVYGVGARDLEDRLEIRRKRRERLDKLFRRKPKVSKVEGSEGRKTS